MRFLVGPLAGLLVVTLANAVLAAPVGLSRQDIGGEPASHLTLVHGRAYSSAGSYVYHDVHMVPWIEGRRHWYVRHYRPAHAEPFRFYPHYYFTPRYIYTPHYRITRAKHRRSL